MSNLQIAGGYAPAVPRSLEDELLAEFLTSRRTVNTMEAYRRDLVQWGEWCAERGIPALQATARDIDTWRWHLKTVDGRSPATIARKLSTLASFYRFIVRRHRDILDRSPAADIDRPTVGDDAVSLGLSRPESVALLTAAELSGPRNHLLVGLMLLAGLRVTEAVERLARDFPVEAGHRIVRFPRKGGKWGQRTVAPELRPSLNTLLRSCTPLAPVFTNDDGSRCDRYDAARILKHLAKAAGVTRKVTPHDLRHTYVTQCREAGIPLDEVQKSVFHRDPKTTLRYEHTRQQVANDPTFRLSDYLFERGPLSPTERSG